MTWIGRWYTPIPTSPYGLTEPSGFCSTTLTLKNCMFMLAKKSVGTEDPLGVGLTGMEIRFSPRPLKLFQTFDADDRGHVEL